MYKPKSNFLKELYLRGYIHQCTDIEKLDEIAQKKRIVGYIGFDCTAESLHVGSLVQLMLLHWMQYYDHKPIALMGGGTTLVGDPSGKNESTNIRIACDLLGAWDNTPPDPTIKLRDIISTIV